MKNTFRITLLLTALAAIFMACEKNYTNIDNGKNNGNENATLERVIIYTVGGNEKQRTLETESEWDAMLEQLCDQARNGSEVTFYNTRHTTGIKSYQKKYSKDNNTISTTNREELKNWMKEKEKQGLTVCISYDENSGTWKGKAYATAPAQNTIENILGRWNFKYIVWSRYDFEGNELNSDLYEPEANGGSMYYTFYEDGTVTLTFNGMDSTTAIDKSKWTLSDDGELSSELLPSGASWNVSWITKNTMILSRNVYGTEEGNYHYQLYFESVIE